MDVLSTTKDLLTAVAAFVGMGLGIYNFLKERLKEKVKLKVIPKAVVAQRTNSVGQQFLLTSENTYQPSYDPQLFAVEVVNFSKFPVVIDEVGFLIRGKKTRISLPNPILGDQGKWPRKLEARESVTVYGNLQDMLTSSDFKMVSHAFAITSCGHMSKGSSNALTSLVKLLGK